MPEDFVNYQIQTIPNNSILDPYIYDKSLSTITAGNKEVANKQSELLATINSLDMNEAEDPFRQQLYNDITKIIKDNSIEKNDYYALNTLIKKYGNIYQIPGVVGRLKAQAAYKAFKNQIDARAAKGEITRDTVEWAKNKNPYKYQDIVDNKGEIIGGTEWTPTITPVEDIDMNKVYAIASQYLKPNKSHWQVTTFLNDDGTTSTTYNPNKTQYILNTLTNDKIEITRDMVDNAINMAINANPEIEASMHQSFEVAKWKHDTGKDKDAPNLAYNSSGNLKSYEEYRNDLIDPYINQMVHSETQSSISWNNAGINAAYKASLNNHNNNGANGNNLPIDLFSRAGSNIGTPMLFDKSRLYSSLRDVNQGKATLSVATQIPITEIPNNYDDFLKLISNNKKFRDKDNSQILSYAKDFYDKYSASIINNENRANSDSELDAATLVQQYIDSNIPLEQLTGTNPYLKKYKDSYSHLVSGIFGDLSNSDTIAERITFKPKYFDRIVLSSDFKNDLRNLGIEIEDNSFILHRGDFNALFTFMNLMRGQEGDIYRDDTKLTHSWFGDTSGFAYSSNKPDSNSEQRLFDFNLKNTQSAVKLIDDFYNSINRVYRDTINKEILNGEDKLLVGTGTLGSYTVDDILFGTMFEQTGENKYKSMQQHSVDMFINRAKSRNLIDDTVYQAVFDEKTNTYNYIELNRAQKDKIQTELTNIDPKKIEGNLSYIQGDEFKQGVIYNRQISTAKEGKPAETERIQLIFGNVQDDKLLKDINSSGYIKATKELFGAYINNEGINIGKVNNNYLVIRGIPNQGDLKYSDLYAISIGNENTPIASVNTKQAASLIAAYRQLINDRTSLTTPEVMAEYIKENPFIRNIYTNIFGEEKAKEIIWDILINKL